MSSPSDGLVRLVHKHWRAMLVWGLGACLVLSGLLLLWAASLQIPDLASLQNRVVEQSLKIYDRTGTVLLYDLNQNSAQRTVVPLSQISNHIQDVVLSMEDPTFYQNAGIEPTAILRALLIDVTSGSASQGGSTITQQVVKNTILTNDKSVARKLKEWVLALKLTRALPKDQILALYLNQAPFGGNIYGAEEASESFFGIPASGVDLAQAAYLAAVLPAPTYYSPWGNHKDALDARKNLVLDKTYGRGYITAAERDEAKQEAVAFAPQKTAGITAPHFVFYVEQYLEDKYGQDALHQNGWKIVTSLDADLQTHAEETVQKWGEYNAQNFNASNAGLVAIDPENGQILAMVGSRNYFDTAIDGNFNIALAKRQPGSAFKPFAYSEAFIKGYTPDTVLFDVPTQFDTGCAWNDFSDNPQCYSPVNYDNQFRGPMTLRNALAQSINVPSVKVLYLAGIADTLTLARTMGITTLSNANQYGLTLVLGGGEVELLDMVSAYASFAQDGTHYAPTPVLTILDQGGAVIEDNSQPAGMSAVPKQVAEEINDILSDPVARAPLGENNLLSFPGRDVAVKTGTTNNYRDAWTIGYTPNLAVGVWAGNNDNTPMVKKVSGFIVGPMWHEFMQYALSKTQAQTFSRSEPDESLLKPQLRGVWKVRGADGLIHELLYWVDKNNPLGPAPFDPNQDSQFKLWDPPVQLWASQHPEAQ